MHQGNSEILSEVCLPATNLMMLRYEDIFDFYSEEPPTIIAKSKVDTGSKSHEQILRIRKWQTQGQSYSWSIYNEEREDFSSNFIIRKVVWKQNLDKVKIQKNAGTSREELLTSWPTIQTTTIFLEANFKNDIVQLMSEMDSILDAGIKLSDNENPIWEWRDIEIKRLSDWGQINLTWSNNKINQKIENKILELETLLEKIVTKEHPNIYSMKFNYSMLPETFQKIVVEGEKL